MASAEVADILGEKKVLRQSIRNRMDVIDLINRGVSKSALMHLVKYLGFTTLNARYSEPALQSRCF